MRKIEDCFYIDTNKPFRVSFDYGAVENNKFYGTLLVNAYGLAVHRARICIPSEEVNDFILKMDELTMTEYMNSRIENWLKYSEITISLKAYVEAVLSPSKGFTSYYFKMKENNSFCVYFSSKYGIEGKFCLLGRKNKSNAAPSLMVFETYEVKYAEVKDEFKGFFNWFVGSVHEKDLLELLNSDDVKDLYDTREAAVSIVAKAYNNYFDIK